MKFAVFAALVLGSHSAPVASACWSEGVGELHVSGGASSMAGNLDSVVEAGDEFRVVCGDEYLILEGRIRSDLTLKMTNGGELAVSGMTKERVVELLPKIAAMLNTPNGIRIQPKPSTLKVLTP